MKIHNYDTDLEELRNCPFCDERPLAYLIGNYRSRKIEIVIMCKKCNIKMINGAVHKSIEWLEEISIKKWNTRIASSSTIVGGLNKYMSNYYVSDCHKAEVENPDIEKEEGVCTECGEICGD